MTEANAETGKVTISHLTPVDDQPAAAILAAATFEGTVEAGAAVIAAARTDPTANIYAARVGDTLVGVYVARENPPSYEVTHLAIAPEARRQGYGRACLAAALYQAGWRPLVAETGDDALPFYRACGFRIVSRKRLPNGTVRYRLGTYVSRPGAEHFPGGYVLGQNASAKEPS